MQQPCLYYTYAGPRQYGRSPVMIYVRKYWEFQAVISGSIAPRFAEGDGAFQSRTLWVFAPQTAHGWTGQGNRSAHIVVFHLPEPDALLRDLVTHNGGMLSCPLTAADCRWMALRHAELAEEWKHPNVATHLKVARLLTGLQLCVLTAIQFKPQPLRHNAEADRIERALYWFRQNLHVHPGVAQVAAAIGVSEVHLRRLFHKVLQTSPKNALQAIRMERAQEILADAATTVDAAAHMLGFADASSLARAYRQHFGQSPRGKSD